MIVQAESPPSDAFLVQRARGGDLGAMDLLARRWQTPLIGFLERQVGRTDAEDLFQETMIRAWQGLGQYDASRPLKPWLLAIAWRLASNHRRNRRLRMMEAVGEGTAGAGPSPAELALQAESRESLWATARRVLGAERCSLLWLFYVEGLTPREISRVSGRSWVSVKTALYRARRELARHVDERRV